MIKRQRAPNYLRKFNRGKIHEVQNLTNSNSREDTKSGEIFNKITRQFSDTEGHDSLNWKYVIPMTF